MSVEFEIHPAADLFPLMTDSELDSLKENIAAHGLLEPIWLYEGKILDGRNRYRACIELGIEVTTRDYVGDSPVAFVWSLNGARRQLSKSELAAVAVEMLAPLQEEAKKRQQATGNAARDENGRFAPVPPILEGPVLETSDPAVTGEAAAIAARIVGVSKTYVHDAKRVKQKSPELFAEVRAGKITVDKALRIADGKYVPADLNGPKQPREKRAADIRRLAASGHKAEQIAAELGIGRQQVRNIATAENIALADDAIGKAHRIKASRVIEEMVHGLEGYALGLSTIEGSILDVSKDDAAHWARSLSESIKPINALRKQLLEMSK